MNILHMYMYKYPLNLDMQLYCWIEHFCAYVAFLVTVALLRLLKHILHYALNTLNIIHVYIHIIQSVKNRERLRKFFVLFLLVYK